MTKTLRWQLYVSFYTLCFGVPLLLFPNAIIPWYRVRADAGALGTAGGHVPAGFVLLVQTVYKKRIVAILLHSIIMRLGFTLVFFALALSGYPPFFYLAAGIVGLGVAGSTLAYLSERHADKPATLKHALGEQP